MFYSRMEHNIKYVTWEKKIISSKYLNLLRLEVLFSQGVEELQ